MALPQPRTAGISLLPVSLLLVTATSHYKRSGLTAEIYSLSLGLEVGNCLAGPRGQPFLHPLQPLVAFSNPQFVPYHSSLSPS